MTDYTNGYFQMMNDIGVGYENARVERLRRKEALTREENWEGLRLWEKREKKNFPFPFSKGQTAAYRAWKTSQLHRTSHFEVSELPWDTEAHDFIQTLREAGVTEFAITDRSTALMELLHLFADEEGCRMVGLCKVERTDTLYVSTVSP